MRVAGDVSTRAVAEMQLLLNKKNLVIWATLTEHEIPYDFVVT